MDRVPVDAGCARCQTCPMHVERLSVRFLDSRGQPLANEAYCSGLPDAVEAPIRQIVRQALALGAAAIAVSHNHPSGIARPSSADHGFTRTLVNALHPLGIRVHDHEIVTARDRYSFRAEGLL